MKIRKIAAITAMAVALVGCSLQDSEVNEIGLIYSGGQFEEKEFIGLFEPGSTNENIGWGSQLYKYPTDQRSWVSDVDAEQVNVVSDDEVGLGVPYQLYFKLNTQEDVLRQFHENIGVKREIKAYTAEGWTRMLNTYFKPQLEIAMDEAALNFNWRDLRSDSETKTKFEDQVSSIFKRELERAIGGEYFCGPTYTGGEDGCTDFQFTVGKPDPLDASFIELIEDEQRVEGRTRSIQAEARQQEVKNEQRRVERKAVQEDVELYGPEVYAYLQCLESKTGVCIPIDTDREIDLERLPLGE